MGAGVSLALSDIAAVTTVIATVFAAPTFPPIVGTIFSTAFVVPAVNAAGVNVDGHLAALPIHTRRAALGGSDGQPGRNILNSVVYYDPAGSVNREGLVVAIRGIQIRARPNQDGRVHFQYVRGGQTIQGR